MRAVAAACLLLLSGCFYTSEHKEKITLNPDGSGKCELRLVIDIAGSQPAGDPITPAQMAQWIIQGGVKGVDGWSGVSFKTDSPKNSTLEFTGTCYFKDIGDFRIDPQIGGGNLHMLIGKFGDDRMALTMDTRRGRAPGGPQAPLPPEAVNKRLADVRARWDELKGNLSRGLAGSNGDAKVEVTYLLPGKVERADGFKIVEGGVQLSADLKQMVAAVDKLMKDDDALGDVISNGHFKGSGSPAVPDQIILAIKMLGKPLTATLGGEFKPVFDYQAEIGAARVAESAMFEKLGLKELSHLKGGQ